MISKRAQNGRNTEEKNKARESVADSNNRNMAALNIARFLRDRERSTPVARHTGASR